MKYSESIKVKVRQNLDYDKEDRSIDNEIDEMSADEVFNRVCTWEGLIGYGDTIREWIRDVYGVKLGGNKND